jgi:sortase (surface protein transpeptidase)
LATRGLGGRRGSRLSGLAAAAALAVAGCGGAADEAAETGGSGDPTTTTSMTAAPTTPAPTEPTTTTTAAPPTTAATAPPAPGVDADAAVPVRVAIPGIGVDAPLVELGLDAAGALEAPTAAEEAGWWTDGPEPGEQGPAVIAGHVDWSNGPAVFFRLDELRPGDTVEVAREDGSTVAFEVTRSERHPKAAFPTQAVYGDTTGSELRLVTCGGVFDRSTGHYEDNVIVYAVRR